MSQERTERDQKIIEDVRKTQRDGGPLWEVELAALREIDRLNAVNADLTAKVQERDEELASWREGKEIQLLASEQDEDSKLMALAREGRLLVEDRDKEIERLRSALEETIEYFYAIANSGGSHGDMLDLAEEATSRVNNILALKE